MKHITHVNNSAILQNRRRVEAGHSRSYDVYIAPDLTKDGLGQLAEALSDTQSLLVTTPTVAGLYAETLVQRLRAQAIDIDRLVVPVGERSKTMKNVMAVCREAQYRKFGRRSILVGMGGGVCTDIVGLAASLFRRGITCIRVPTTVIGQVDASVGIKSGINFGGKKNSLGCFYPPQAVYIDPTFLKTLSEEQVSHGIAEIVKMALIRDARLFELIEQFGPDVISSGFQQPRDQSLEILQRSIFGMLDELEANINEDQTYRRLVDFGHTFGPTIEAVSGFRVPHGQAVSIGMSFSCAIGKELGMLDQDSFVRAIRCIQRCNLPTDSPLLTPRLAEDAIEEASRHRGGRLNLVVPRGIGSASFIQHRHQVSLSIIENAMRSLRSRTSIVSSKVPKYDHHDLVFDVGGTNVRAALYDRIKNKLVSRASQATPSHYRYPELNQDDIVKLTLQRMDALSSELARDLLPKSVSIAFSGPLNERNEVTDAPTIWGASPHSPIDLVSELRRLWPHQDEIHLLNDVTAAGYRYLREPDESLCIITVGSGIGNKVFIDGAPFTGPHGRGGEIGHVVVDHAEDAIICDCGARGHLGAIASGRGTLALARHWAEIDPTEFGRSRLASICAESRIENAHVVRMFQENDSWTVRLIQHVAGKLASALAHLHQGLGIERFIIFGGFALALGERYRTFLVQSAEKDCWDSGQNWDDMVELGASDDDSGLLGAGRFAAEFCERI